MFEIKIATIITLVVLVGAPSLCRGQCRWGPASPRLPIGLTLVIRTAKPVARVSDPVIIHIELFNQSDTSISMIDMMWELRDYDLRLYDDKGKQAPFTKWGQMMKTGPIRGSSIRAVLAPGEKLEFDEDLSKIYSVSVPGSYTAEACRELNRWGNIYSNKLVIPFTH